MLVFRNDRVVVTQAVVIYQYFRYDACTMEEVPATGLAPNEAYTYIYPTQTLLPSNLGESGVEISA